MKIAHISDFHLRHHLPGTASIAKRRSRDMPDLTPRAIQDIQAEEPDLVAVTGDLVDHPFDLMDDPDTILLGEKDLRLVGDLFAPLTCPVAFLFGNHDRPESFRKVFQALSRDLEVSNHRILTFADNEAEDNCPERLGAERKRFRRALDGNDPRPQIHLQHYLISPQHTEGYPHNYRDATSLEASISAEPRVRLVLSGHYHKGETPISIGSATFSTVPAFCEAPHPYRIYTLSEETVSHTEHHLE